MKKAVCVVTFETAVPLGKTDSSFLIRLQSTVRKKMATGTFTYKCLARENRKNAHKNSQKNLKNLKPSMNNVVSTGKNFAKTQLSMCHIGCVRFAGYCGQMYRHLFFLRRIEKVSYLKFLFALACIFSFFSFVTRYLELWRVRILSVATSVLASAIGVRAGGGGGSWGGGGCSPPPPPPPKFWQLRFFGQQKKFGQSQF